MLTSRILPVVLTLCLAACGWNAKKDDKLEDPQTMYKEAKDFADAGSYESAIKAYEKLEARYPYGTYAQQAQLDVAYTYFQLKDQSSAVAACDRFIKLYPNHARVDYAYYLKGMALIGASEQDPLTAMISPMQPLSERDSKSVEESFDVFKHLVTQYPASPYAEDAKKQLLILVNAMAAHELNAARYYMNRRAPLAAINRAQQVVKTFPDSDSVEEALAIMVQGYERLGKEDLKADTARILAQSYPNSRFLK